MEETRIIKLDKYDYKLIINALNEFRNLKIKEDIDTEIIDELLLIGTSSEVPISY